MISDPIVFEITGCAAHSRIAPLVPTDWVDATKMERRNNKNEVQAKSDVPHFLWENAPRRETKEYRDHVKCYSHLPNGLTVLDSKWSLSRLFNAYNEQRQQQDPQLTILTSHCFRGISGFKEFCEEVAMFNEPPKQLQDTEQRLPDIYDSNDVALDYPPSPHNLWVVKDDMANGAGGIYMVNPDNAEKFLLDQKSPLVDDHRYVAQQYAWPPVLFQGKKCHVRVYGLFTADGRAFVHEKCFLHVANEPFQAVSFDEDSVHITNCCANSHDKGKFAGEICADLSLHDFGNSTECGQPIIPLAKFYDSIAASVAHLGKRAFPFLKGGDWNHGLEYLGMDFILSYRDGAPVAYLLEVNAPPSQDTATGLPHAEQLHNSVLYDLIHLWVLPSVTGAQEKLGGWKCVFQENPSDSPSTILPSKAVILNKIRWAIFERKSSKRDEEQRSCKAETRSNVVVVVELSPSCIATFARSQFPYFRSNSTTIFMENAGGAQVPYAVVDEMTRSISYRNRSVIGSEQKSKARIVAKVLLGCSPRQFVHFGANATSLLCLLAQKLVGQLQLQTGDEIVLSSENHLANTQPWVDAAKLVGATIVWWSVMEPSIASVLSARTKIVALSHASNILGQVRDIGALGAVIKQLCPDAQIIVDGVAAAPHIFANLEETPVDWYVVSCHKMFGPHLGILCGPVYDPILEIGTINYEACAGLIGLGAYFGSLGTFSPKDGEQSASQSTHSEQDRREGRSERVTLTRYHVLQAYQRISIVEEILVQHLMKRLCQSSDKLQILEATSVATSKRLPVISFRHQDISSRTIVQELSKKVACRESTFLCTEQLHEELQWKGNVVRLSLVHYNTTDEINLVLEHLEELQSWA